MGLSFAPLNGRTVAGGVFYRRLTSVNVDLSVGRICKCSTKAASSGAGCNVSLTSVVGRGKKVSWLVLLR